MKFTPLAGIETDFSGNMNDGATNEIHTPSGDWNMKYNVNDVLGIRNEIHTPSGDWNILFFMLVIILSKWNSHP